LQVLKRLVIRDFGIIENLEWRPGPGLNIITGETGAGKSLVLDALDVLLGRRVGQDVIRAGSSTASIEAELGLPASQGVETVLLLRREVERTGRGSAQVDGRVVPVKSLREAAGLAFDLHGPNQQFSLLESSEQLSLLDAYAGTLPLRNDFSATAEKLMETRAQLETVLTDEQQLARRRDLLQFEAGEISAAALDPDEAAALEEENNLLTNMEKLRELVCLARGHLSGEDVGAQSVVDGLGEAVAHLTEAAHLDRRLDALAQTVEAAFIQAEDAGRELSSYCDSLEYDPERHEQVQARLGLIKSLKKKYGGTVDAVIAHGVRAEAELASLDTSDAYRAGLERDEAQLRAELAVLGEQLSAQRHVAAEALSAEVERELHELNMGGTGFMVSFDLVEEDEDLTLADGTVCGFTRDGIDDVEFLIRPNPGEPFLPLARIASTGETSRLMLALRCALVRGDAVPTLVFDEIDMGIGGRSGEIIGKKLALLARRHQVICITHLPQVAAYGDTQYSVEKRVVGERTFAVLHELTRSAREAELSEMLGSLGEPSMFGAQELLQRARAWKESAPQLQ